MKRVSMIVACLLLVTGLLFAGAQQEKAEPAAEKVQIHWLLHWITEQGPDKINEVKRAFEAQNPDIELIFDNIPFVQMHDKVLTLSMAGMAPDIVTVSGAWVTEFANQGIIVPLDDYISALPKDYTDALAGPAMLPWKGHLYGIPVTNGNIGLYYNTQILADAGVEPPTTWDELVAACIKVNNPSEGVYALTGNIASEPPTTINYEVFPLIMQAGGKILDGSKAAFNSPEGVKAITFLKDLMKTYKVMTPGELNAGEKEKRANFSAGNVAFMFEGPWGVGIQQKANPDLKFGVVPLPVGEVSGNIVLGSVLGITKDSKNKDAAFKFLEFMGSAEGQLLWDKATGFFPYNKVTMQDSYFQNDPYLKVFADQQINTENMQVIDNYLPQAVDLKRQFTIEIQNFLTDKKTAQQALDDAAAYWDAEFAKYAD